MSNLHIIENNKKQVSLEVTNGHSMFSINVFDEESGRAGSYFLQHTRHSLARSEQRGNGHIVTCYKGRAVLKNIQRKEKYLMAA